MKKIIRSVLIASLCTTYFSAAYAQAELSKSEAKEQAISVCQAEAKQRYGDNAVITMGKKAKWKKGLKGAQVKLKVKPESKRASKHTCVLGLDSSVTFYKA